MKSDRLFRIIFNVDFYWVCTEFDRVEVLFYILYFMKNDRLFQIVSNVGLSGYEIRFIMLEYLVKILFHV